MSIDGKILARAKMRLEAQKLDFEVQHERRLSEVYLKSPRIKTIDRELKGTVIDVIGLALKNGQDPSDAIADLRDKNLYLQSERVQALIKAGFPPDYIDDDYLCCHCHDTGYIGTEPCACLKRLYNEEQTASLSSLFKLGNETFDSFDLNWYDDNPDPNTGLSSRKTMEIVYDTCVDYAMRFARKSSNLFLSGSTGLGKTFLSACIARVVSDSGFSVAYDMASSIFAKFEEEKFSKSDDLAVTRDEIRRYLDCDLLIMDDLGTEMTTAFTISALYELINTRLIHNKKTIINTNLALDELRLRYSPQIASRIVGEYHVLKFNGRDIRLLKKEM